MARIENIQIGDVVVIANTTFEVVARDNMPDTNGVALQMLHACDACGCIYTGDDFETSTGVVLCSECVDRVLTYRVVRDVLDNIGDYDVPLARAIEILDDDDVRARASNMPYYDSSSCAWDTLRSESYDNIVHRVRAHIVDVIASATREPGSVR